MASRFDPSDEKFNNYVTLITALKLSQEGLEDFVNNSVKDLFKKISNKCTGYLPCTTDCPKVHVANFKKWCATCRKWKEEITRYMRFPGRIKEIQWKVFDSKYWTQAASSSAINQVANVFVHKCRNSQISVTEDFSCIISLLENCSYFSIGKRRKILIDVREVRNKYFAHNPKFTIDEKDLDNCLNVLGRLLKDISLIADHKCTAARKRICDLKIKKTRQKSHEIAEIHPILITIISLHRDKPKIVIQKTEELISSKHSTYLTRQLINPLLILLCLFFLGYLYYTIKELTSNDDIRKELTSNDGIRVGDCKTMDFQFPWKSDLNFKTYIYNFNDFVGREWMLEDVSYELIHTNRRGILIAAEMGFGKSALVAQIACSYDKRLPGFPIFEKMVAIHFCRYDSNFTLHPGVFVRNIAGKFSELYPEYGNIINTDNTASSYLSRSKCLEDPIGCFEYTVLYPLRRIKSLNTIMVIIIDALDECIEIGPSNIFSLLRKKINLLPHNVKFLFTSRNISSVRVNLPSDVSVYQSENLLKRNLDDIRKYLKKKLENDTVKEHFQNMFSNSGSSDVIEKLLDLVGGNFLFLTHAFEAWVKIGNINDFPRDMEDIYRTNVERIFGKNENMFDNVRSIFEVLCASHGSVNESLLFEVLNIVERKQKIYFSRLLSNELSHFVKRSSGRIVFTNKRLADFFSRQDNIENDFYILQQHGHELLAQFWISHLETCRSKKTSIFFIIDIIQHAACSKNQSLEYRLIKAVRNCLNTNSTDFLKHYVAASLNSYEAMLLAIECTSDTDIDKRDQGNLTASYIAAAYGNDKSLAALLKRGAYVDFQRSQPAFSKIFPNQDPINLSKYIFQWEYNLANIAAQNGHDNTIQLLLKHNINICNENSVGLNSFHLAAEHGHTSILRILMSSSKCNWNLSFQTSLYLAAKNGHLNVVRYLLSLNAVDKCVPCLDSMNWIPKGKIRLQSNLPLQKLPERDYRNFLLKEDSRFFYCESALDIAVQNRHIEIVKVLVAEKVNAVKCVNARGMTPLITAVTFKRDDIVLFFLQTGLPLNDTCKVMISMKTRFHHNDNRQSSDERFCVKGLSFWHMLAIHLPEKTVEFVYTLRQFDYIWNIRDENGVTPFHYICCNGNFNFTHKNVLKTLTSHMLDRTLNGSTPAHSAALCGKYVTIILFVRIYKIQIDIKDKNGKNVLHYFALSELEFILEDILLDIYSKSYDKLLSEQDVDGRTPLHYAAISGKLLFHKENDWSISFNPQHFMIQDQNNMTVLDHLFRNMPSIQPKDGENNFAPHYDCDEDNLFRIPGCSNIRSKILDRYEFFAFKAFSHLKDTNFLKRKSIYKFMNESLKKNRFYLIQMIKVLYPKQYEKLCKKRVHYFLAQLFKKSSYPNSILSSTFMPDLMIASCESKQKDNSLRSIFYDKRRTFWPMYLYLNGTKFRDTVQSVLEKCSQRGLPDAVVKGGNMMILIENSLPKPIDIYLEHYIRKAPCIITDVKYLVPRIHIRYKILKDRNIVIIPYSHPLILQVHNVHKFFPRMIYEKKAELSLHHIAAAKGFTSLFSFSQFWTKQDFYLENKSGENYITPNMLAYFFNHDWPFERYVNTNKFFSSHFVSLFFKVIMDFHTFVFPKNSAAWKCYQHIHKINRESLKMFVCRAKLQEEICSIISKLHFNNWRLIYHLYTFKKIFADHRVKHPFDFISYFQRVRTKCCARKTTHLLSQVETLYNAKKTVFNLCNATVESGHSRFCLKNISFLNKQRKYVNYHIKSLSFMYFPLTYIIYDLYIGQLPDLAQKDTIEIIQIMHAYGSVPFFHNHPTYDYWNVLNSSFSNPFRTMTESILKANVSEIISWIRELNNYDNSAIEGVEQGNLYDNPLNLYDNLTVHD